MKMDYCICCRRPLRVGRIRTVSGNVIERWMSPDRSEPVCCPRQSANRYCVAEPRMTMRER